MKTALLSVLLLAAFWLQAQDTKKDIKKAAKIAEKGDEVMAQPVIQYHLALKHYLEAEKLDTKNAKLKFKIGVCLLNTITPTKAIPYFEKAQQLNPNIDKEVHYLLGRVYHLTMDFDKALAAYKKYKQMLTTSEQKEREVIRYVGITMVGVSADDPKKRAASGEDRLKIQNLAKVTDKRIQECENGKRMVASPVEAIVKNLGSPLNSAYPDYGPVISADESVMYFTARKPETTGGQVDPFDQEYLEDIYVSYSSNDKWGSPKNMGTNINSEIHDGAVGTSADGQIMFIFKDDKNDGGDLFESRLKGTEWSKPRRMDKPINSDYADKTISLSGDGMTYYFVSNRPGGQGGKDIYVCSKGKKGKFTEAKNLGLMVNTPYDEDGVFIHPDGKTLYFSSQGHNSMGGYDIFKSVFENNKWSAPENLGYPINTTGDDIYFVLSASGERGYYASHRKDGLGEDDIYVILMPKPKKVVDTLTEAAQPEPVNPLTLLKGVIRDAVTKQALEAGIQVVDNEKNEIIAELTSNQQTGRYLVTLPSGKNYGITVQKEGYMFHSENFDIPASKDYQEVVKDVELNKVAVGTKVVLRNIFFDFDKATLRSESVTELERVLKFMGDFPNIRIELSGHTDDKGSDEYNLRLSQKRAESVVEYLITKGVAKERLRAMGYGETRPMAPNQNTDGTDNPDGRQLNRRTEFEIIGN